MAWDKAAELLVGITGEVYVAPSSTTLPTTPTATLNAAFVGLGYTDEDGVTVTADPEIQEYRAWQSRSAVRREMTQQNVSVAFKLEQWNEDTIVLAFGGGEVTSPSTGVYKYTLPEAGDAVDERALVVDVRDGSTNWRFVFPRGNVSESVASDFKRTELALLPITFRALAPSADPNGSPAYFLTDSAAFAAGS